VIAAIYSRKSKFTGKGESIENQIHECKEYCTRLGISDFLVYEDEGFSGGSTNRPEFQRLLKDAKKKRFNVLVCYRLDRISRNVSDFSTLINDLQLLNIDFISIREQFDTTTPMGRAMMYISSVFAQLERETIAERIRDNMMQLARTGRWLGGKTPTGFISEQVTNIDNKGKERKMYKLSPVEVEQEQVKLLYDKYIELGGIHKLEGFCFKNNIVSRNGVPYDKSSLVFLLTNPVYCVADEYFYEYCISCGMDLAMDKESFTGKYGAMVFNKRNVKVRKRTIQKSEEQWVVAVGLHKGIIPSRQWIQVQQIYKTNSDKAPREGTSKVGLLTPLLICGKCRTPLRMTYGRPKAQGEDGRHHYYKCRLKERSRGTQCNMVNLNGFEADTLVVEQLKQVILNNKIMENKIKGLKGSAKGTDSSKDKITKKINETESGIENLTIQLSKNESSTAAAYIIKQIEKLDKQLQEYKKELYDIEDTKEKYKMDKLNLELFNNELKHFIENFDNLEFEDKKKALQRIVKEIVWDGENLDIKLLVDN
jgi:site-specific DNA recombinase